MVDSNNKNNDASSKLAEAIAGQDINSLKEMILDQMGIDNQDELIDRVLEIIDDEDENTADRKDEAQVVELYKKPEEYRTSERSNDKDNETEPNERKQSKDSRFDPLDLLLNNRDLIFNMIKDSIFNVKPEDDARVQLLYALKPFCNDKRQDRIDSAVKMMGITRYIEKAKKKE